MFSISEVVGKLGSMPQIVSVYIPDESDIRTFYEEESRVSTISDMPMENEAMAVSKSRKHHLIVVYSIKSRSVEDHNPLNSYQNFYSIR